MYDFPPHVLTFPSFSILYVFSKSINWIMFSNPITAARCFHCYIFHIYTYIYRSIALSTVRWRCFSNWIEGHITFKWNKTMNFSLQMRKYTNKIICKPRSKLNKTNYCRHFNASNLLKINGIHQPCEHFLSSVILNWITRCKSLEKFGIKALQNADIIELSLGLLWNKSATKLLAI